MTTTVAAEPTVLPRLLARIMSGETLNADDAEAAFTVVMSGQASPVQIAALLAALRSRGEVAEEVAGGVRALRAAMHRVPARPGPDLVDTCGTGGGAFTTFNISTAAALLAAGAGARVAKHGNRSFTSRCGSADVLEALSVPIELTPDAMGRVLDEAGVVFMFAPLLHPAMRHVAPVRRELGVPTIMNLLGPLTNPAGAKRQLVGVADPARIELVAGALQALGHERALVVHGQPGMDELSPIGPSEGIELRDGELVPFRLDPRTDLGWPDFDAEDLAAGDPTTNAGIVLDVLAGRGRPGARAATVLNAGAAIYLAGLAATLVEGVHVAEEALESGAGMAALDRLRSAARAAAAAREA